jgi:hypothetical protein
MLRLEGDERWLVWTTLAIKAALPVLGFIAYQLVTGRTADGLPGALNLWDRWDGPHYTDLIVFGYRAVDDGNLVGPNGYRQVYPGDVDLYIVFFPLYPWLGTAVNAILGAPYLSALVVTTVASLFVAPLLYRVVRQDEDPGVAFRAGIFLLLFPTAYFLHIGYTEALFLALVLGSFLAARTDRWWLAGILGGLAALTRVNGLVLIPALAAEAATQWFARPPAERRLRMEWLAIGLVGVGFAGYLALNLAVYGDPFAFLTIQREHWFKQLAPPWEGLDGVLGWIDRGSPEEAFLYGWTELAFIGLGLAGVIHAAFRFRPSWFAWMAGNWLLFISTSFVLSVPRYSLTLFPLFVSLALLTRRWQVAVLLSGISLIGFVYWAGRFASGEWAF